MPRVSERTAVGYIRVPQKSSKKSEENFNFVSLHKSTSLYDDSHKEYYTFTNHGFVTTDPKKAAFLKEHPAYGLEIFENEYPPEVRERINKDKSYLTRQKGANEG